LSDEDRIARHLDRLRQNDPTEDDLARVDRQLQAVAQQQTNVAQAVTMLDGNAEALAPLAAQLGTLGKQRQALDRDRVDLLRRQAAWQAAHLRLDDIRVYCRRVAANLGPATFAEQRKRLTQLRVRVEVFRADHSPRWIATSEIIPEAAMDSNLFNAV
jgi:hypothetical protein